MNVVRQDVFKEESGIDTPVNDYESFFFDESKIYHFIKSKGNNLPGTKF